MRHSLRPHSRLFRSLLALALIAWTALAFDAFAHPLAMSVGMEFQARVLTGNTMLAHCEHMTKQAFHGTHPVPSHPAGHGCCANGSCYCASLCNGIADVPRLELTVVPAHQPALVPVTSAPALATSAPPIRPPIA